MFYKEINHNEQCRTYFSFFLKNVLSSGWFLSDFVLLLVNTLDFRDILLIFYLYHAVNLN